MSKVMDFNAEARRKLKEGIASLAQAVVITLGPKGRTVVFEKHNGEPQVCNDGVTVAKQVEMDDPVADLGAKMLRQVAVKTSEKAGDGTTTATLLAASMIDIGLRRVKAGVNPMEIRRGISKAVKTVVEDLKRQAQPIGTDESKIEQVATISANNDPDVGRLVAEAVARAGKEGVITTEEAKGMETTIEVVEGLRFDRGYLSAYFVTDREKMEAAYENPYVLLYDKKISNIKEVLPVLEKVSQAGEPLLIVADDLEQTALAVLVVNTLGGVLKAVAVKSPGFGERKKDYLEDIAVLTGGTVISEEKGVTLENIELDKLGRCEKVIVNKDTTTIINGKGNKEAVKNRIREIKAAIERTDSDYDREKLRERQAKLSGGVAVVYVGAATEVEMGEKKDRVEDALNATRAAMEEGFIPGGGVAYPRNLPALEKLKPDNEEERIGINIIKRSMEEPLRQILRNAGLEENEIVHRVKAGKQDFGFNAKTEKFEHLLGSGVIDPLKVCRLALENAASVVSMMLTTECVIAKRREKPKEEYQPLANEL